MLSKVAGSVETMRERQFAVKLEGLGLGSATKTFAVRAVLACHIASIVPRPRTIPVPGLADLWYP